jgi:hypothetical protein
MPPRKEWNGSVRVQILSRVGRKILRENRPTRFLYVRVVTVRSEDSFVSKPFCISVFFHLNTLVRVCLSRCEWLELCYSGDTG